MYADLRRSGELRPPLSLPAQTEAMSESPPLMPAKYQNAKQTRANGSRLGHLTTVELNIIEIVGCETILSSSSEGDSQRDGWLIVHCRRKSERLDRPRERYGKTVAHG